MKRLSTGLRTGLLTKEQLLLAPYFPSHALILLKYAPHHDERAMRKTSESIPRPPGLEEPCEDIDAGESVATSHPPATRSLPMPSFGGKRTPAPTVGSGDRVPA